mgnify:CR=1 FL=1
MLIHNEKIDYEYPLLSLKVYQSRRPKQTKAFNEWHYHKEMEILAIHSGTLEVHIEDEVHLIPPGGVVVIGPSQLHRDRSLEALHYTILQFDLQPYFEQSTLPYIRLFSDQNTPLSKLNYEFENEEIRSAIYHCVTEIFRETQEKQSGYEIAVNVLIKKILLILLRNDTRKVLTANLHPDVMRLKPALDYIDEHICEKVSVENAAKRVGMSYYYFVKYFRRTMGMNFTEFVNYKKIKTAERILLTKKMPVSSVGESIGMPNMAHFYKVFRKYNHCSPNEYRKRMKEWSN